MSKKEQIIEKLKENGCRITKQRKMLLDIRCGNCLQNDQCIRRNRSNQQKKYV